MTVRVVTVPEMEEAAVNAGWGEAARSTHPFQEAKPSSWAQPMRLARMLRRKKTLLLLVGCCC